MRALIGSLFFLMISAQAVAAGDTGKVVEYYAHPDGHVAIRLDGGLPGANAVNNCGTTANQWAGVDPTVDPSMKAALLTAKASGSTVLLVTLGRCVGGWIKIEAMHIR